MKPLVVLVGNSRKKLDRLKKLYSDNKPLIAHDVVVVYNGEEKYKCDLKTENNRQGRDVYMYHKAVMKWKRDFYFFMNDDIIHIEGTDWLENALRLKAEIVGAQTNLSSIVSSKIIKKLSGKNPSRGTNPQFIRTSAFGCTRDYFLRIWEESKGNSQRFEKNTLKLANSWAVLCDAFYIHDENLHSYFNYYRGQK